MARRSSSSDIFTHQEILNRRKRVRRWRVTHAPTSPETSKPSAALAEISAGAAAQWFRKAAQQGDVYAQYNLAVMLLKGQGTPQDSEATFRWCRIAAEQGLAEAQARLGDSYQAERVKDDHALAHA